MPSVDFARSLTVGASPNRIWEILTDVHQVAGWVSIIGEVDEHEPLARYTATLTDRLGPFQLSAELNIDVVDLQPGERIRFTADGEDHQLSSRIQLEAELRLTRTGEHTTIDVDGRYQVTGRVATLGASMIRSKGEKILEEFFAAAQRELS